MARNCTKCKESKQEHEFPPPYKVQRKNSVYNHRRSKCRDCTNTYQREAAQRRKPENGFEIGGMYRSKRKLWECYGMTPEDYITMYEEQNGLCAICSEEQAAVVDHDHGDGHVRGLLCSHCNIMIGNALDQIPRLARAIEYLNNDAGNN